MVRIEAGLIFAGYEFDDQVDPFEAGHRVHRGARPRRGLHRPGGARGAQRAPAAHAGGPRARGQRGGRPRRPGLRRPPAASAWSRAACAARSCKKSIALCRMAVQYAEIGTEVEVGKLDGLQKRHPGHGRALPVLRPREEASAFVNGPGRTGVAGLTPDRHRKDGAPPDGTRAGVANLTAVSRSHRQRRADAAAAAAHRAGEGGARRAEGPAGVAKLTPAARATAEAGRALRQVMGRFATGVTVVTTADGDAIHGMTANAFLSVSLTPPLVLISLGRCRMAEMLPRTGRYGVSVLSDDQEHLAAHFAGQRPSPDGPRVHVPRRPAVPRRRPGAPRLPRGGRAPGRGSRALDRPGRAPLLPRRTSRCSSTRAASGRSRRSSRTRPNERLFEVQIRSIQV